MEVVCLCFSPLPPLAESENPGFPPISARRCRPRVPRDREPRLWRRLAAQPPKVLQRQAM